MDGFRFDEGSILSRGEDGAPMAHPPVIWSIELSESLAGREDHRRGVGRGRPVPDRLLSRLPLGGMERPLPRRHPPLRPRRPGTGRGRRLAASRGSADIYQTSGHLPINSINFVTCHDGFTLNDLVSYNAQAQRGQRRGQPRRHQRQPELELRRGGPTDDPAVEALRSRQVRNFAAILLLAQGVPMILAGDEVRRTQQGNNNAYCQDNEISWFDWRPAGEARATCSASGS